MQSSIDILCPGLMSAVGQWYSTTDAAADGMPPHVTLLWPWVVAPVSPAQIDQVSEALTGIAPFELRFDRCGRFPGVVFLVPSPVGPIESLIARLVASFPATPPYGGLFGASPSPHLTIAKSANESALELVQAEAQAELDRAPLSLLVDRVSISEEGLGPRGTWAIRHEHLLS